MISHPDYRNLPHSLSIVIPAYNEEQRLPDTLHKLERFLAANSFEFVEVLVVNDGSKDGTARLIEEWSKGHPEFRLLENPGNRGKGYSVAHGLQKARGEWRLFSDADLSAPIEELQKLWAAVREGKFDIAIGSRALDRSLIQTHQSKFREFGGIVFNRIIRVLTGLPFRDTQCGFKLFSARAAQEVFSRITVDGFGFDAESLFVARLRGFKIAEVPVRWSHVEGTKMRLGSDSATMIMDLFRARKNQALGKYR